MDTPISRAEHEEFKHRMEDENHRQNKRLDVLEGEIREIRKLTETVAELAQSMKAMTKEQERQGVRLGKIESRDGETWRKVVIYSITTAVGLILGYFFTIAVKGV